MGVHINWLAILAAGVASQILGMLWYSPFLFGKIWSKEMGWGKISPAKVKKMQQEAMPGYIASFFGAMLSAYVIAHLIVYTRATGYEAVLQMIFWVWLGFTATTQMTDQFFGKKSVKLFLINSLHQLVLFAIIALILVKLA